MKKEAFSRYDAADHLKTEEDITRLDMAISDGMKLIISGGAVVPNRASGEAVLINNPAEASATV